MSETPYDELDPEQAGSANEADLAEQHTPAAPDYERPEPTGAVEADPADAQEQQQPVASEEDYPHDSERGA
jgi:hypothetical protein